ncbi:MAG: anti-sigma factor [Gemmatimonadales bacterium]|nr:anti-sigma factor [Gemmatimonadales bacterium]
MSAPEQETLQDLAAAYALGALSPDEAGRFEAFLAGSVEAQREVAEYRDVAALLALSGADAEPGPGLRERVVGRARRPEPATYRRRSPLLWGALAASLLAALGLGAGMVSVRGEAVRLRALVDSTSATLAAREATLDAIFSPGVRMFQLTAAGDPDPGIQFFWDRVRNRALLHGFQMRPVPQDRAYQLWFIQGGKPVPSVTFKPDAGGHAIVPQVEVPAGGDITAAAVTVEPEAGSDLPTSPILMVGSLERS